MILHELLRNLMAQSPEVSDEDIARELLASLRVNAKATEVLVPLVEEEVKWLYRVSARHVERATSKRRLVGLDPIDVIALRASRLEKTFALGDGRIVKRGDATIADHEQRIDLLTKMRAGLALTIAEHEDDIAAIKEAGVTCLREIEEAA